MGGKLREKMNIFLVFGDEVTYISIYPQLFKEFKETPYVYKGRVYVFNSQYYDCEKNRYVFNCELTSRPEHIKINAKVLEFEEKKRRSEDVDWNSYLNI